jgi:hypothetical protein
VAVQSGGFAAAGLNRSRRFWCAAFAAAVFTSATSPAKALATSAAFAFWARRLRGRSGLLLLLRLRRAFTTAATTTASTPASAAASFFTRRLLLLRLRFFSGDLLLLTSRTLQRRLRFLRTALALLLRRSATALAIAALALIGR